jgi:hypothetical protein
LRPIESTHERKDTGDDIGEMEGKTVEPEDDESDPLGTIAGMKRTD